MYGDDMKIKDLNVDFRPREKLIKFGAVNLSDVELLAIIIGSGTKNVSAIDMGNQMLNEFGLNKLSQLSYDELIKIKGIKDSKACTILACFEIVRRSMMQNKERKTFEYASDIFEYLHPIIMNKPVEALYIMYVDSKAKLINLYLANEGDIASVSVPIRKIIKKGLELNAYGLFMIHNHPSGEVSPSSGDIKSTVLLQNACQSVEMVFIDHVIIGEKTYYSFMENKSLDEILDIEFIGEEDEEDYL